MIDPSLLEHVAKVLKVPVEAIKNFDESAAVNFIASTFHDNASIINTNCTLNIKLIEKWMEALEKNKRLYERLLQAEKEKNELLQKVLDKLK